MSGCFELCAFRPTNNTSFLDLVFRPLTYPLSHGLCSVIKPVIVCHCVTHYGSEPRGLVQAQVTGAAAGISTRRALSSWSARISADRVIGAHATHADHDIVLHRLTIVFTSFQHLLLNVHNRLSIVSSLPCLRIIPTSSSHHHIIAPHRFSIFSEHPPINPSSPRPSIRPHCPPPVYPPVLSSIISQSL